MLKSSTLLGLALFALFAHPALQAAPPPQVGEIAPNFTLQTLDDRPVELTAVLAKSPVLLIMLRGWPGYQCPLCTKQVHDYITHADEFKKRGVQVLMVYPGPTDDLKAHAKEFLQDKQWPEHFLFVTDPNYTFTNAYGLRWDAPKETAYPSTFLLSTEGKVQFAHISKTHGNRVGAVEALAEIK